MACSLSRRLFFRPRSACAGFLSCSHSDVTIHRTKGRKPYLANGHDGLDGACGEAATRRLEEAPNWNFNVSHEGNYVILASEPSMLCGVDVAAPGQLRRQRNQGLEDLFDVMKDNFTAREWAQVHGSIVTVHDGECRSGLSSSIPAASGHSIRTMEGDAMGQYPGSVSSRTSTHLSLVLGSTPICTTPNLLSPSLR
eukprot:scaffold192973_cov34-Tisochrysis_lutea.AAC.4